jgi:hypothetical protein
MGLATYFLVATGEYGISTIALFLLGISCFIMVRRRNDPLRTPFLYLKLAISFYFVYAELPFFAYPPQPNLSDTYLRSMLASTISYIATSIIIMLNPDGIDDTILSTISNRVGPIGDFVESVGDVQLILCIVELSLSFFRAMGRPSSIQTIFRVAALAAAVLLLVLATAAFGVQQAYITEILKSDTYENTRISASTVNRLYGSWSVIHFLAALGLEALSLMVFSSSHKKRQYTKVTFSPPFPMDITPKPRNAQLLHCNHADSIQLTRRLLVVTTLNNLRTTYDLYMAARYSLSRPRDLPYYSIILTPILYMWTTIVILSLLTDIGNRKHDGLWSNSNSISGLQPNNGFNPNTTYGPWNGGNAGPNTQGGSGYQHQPPPEYGQCQQLGSYNPRQQPTQAEVHGGNAPARSELAALPSQQYQQMYMQQQPQPLLEGQQSPYRSVPQFAPVEAHGQPISPFGSVPGGWTTQQQPPPGQPGVQHVYEVAGMGDQKG